MFTLKVLRGDKIVQELDLDGPEVKIGRSPDNQVTLADDGKGVSRVHAFIRLEDGDYVLYDANSRNGTYVDGKPIKRQPIQPGQEFVVGPYRLVFGSSEYSGSMPTVISPRAEPAAPAPPSGEHGTAQGAGRTGTAKGGQTGTAQGSTKSRPAAPSGKTTPGVGKAAPVGVKAPVSTAYVAIGAIAAIVVLGVALWALWPSGSTEIAVVSTTTITTSVPETTTSVPETTTTIDPHAETITAATLALDAVETTITEKRFITAEREINRVLKESIAPVLAIDPQYQTALDLEARAKTRLAEVREIRLAAEKEKTSPAVPVDPNAVARRAGESDADYTRRNALAQQDYTMATRLYNQGELQDALKILNDLTAREPGWRDVSTYARNAQEGLAKARATAINDALGPEGEGHKLMMARRFPEAAAALLSARKLWDRAVAMQAPGAEKHLADNLDRRRRVAKDSLDIAYTHLNRRNIPEAVKYLQLVLSLLPPGEPLHVEAQKTLERAVPKLACLEFATKPSAARHAD